MKCSSLDIPDVAGILFSKTKYIYEIIANADLPVRKIRMDVGLSIARPRLVRLGNHAHLSHVQTNSNWVGPISATAGIHPSRQTSGYRRLISLARAGERGDRQLHHATGHDPRPRCVRLCVTSSILSVLAEWDRPDMGTAESKSAELFAR